MGDSITYAPIDFIVHIRFVPSRSTIVCISEFVVNSIITTIITVAFKFFLAHPLGYDYLVRSSANINTGIYCRQHTDTGWWICAGIRLIEFSPFMILLLLLFQLIGILCAPVSSMHDARP